MIEMRCKVTWPDSESDGGHGSEQILPWCLHKSKRWLSRSRRPLGTGLLHEQWPNRNWLAPGSWPSSEKTGKRRAGEGVGGEKGRGSRWKGTERQIGKNEVGVHFFSHITVFYCPGATIAKHHTLRCSNSRHLWSRHSRGLQSVTVAAEKDLLQASLRVVW